MLQIIMRETKIMLLTAMLAAMLVLASCATKPLSNKSDLCQIFQDKPAWYKSAKKSAQRWNAPLSMPMAIMYQESSFKRKARPPMNYFLGFIPTGRASNAYGYSQALTGTWQEYQQEMGKRFSERDNFANAYDFIQWYMHKSYQRNGVSKLDGYSQYLNYHEGQGGYARGTYKSKQWLIQVAQRVDRRAKQYAQQLRQCQPKLDRKRTWF